MLIVTPCISLIKIIENADARLISLLLSGVESYL